MRNRSEYESLLQEILQLNKRSFEVDRELKKSERINILDWEYAEKKRKREMYWNEYDKVNDKVRYLKKMIRDELSEHADDHWIKQYLERLEIERSHRENDIYQWNKNL